MRILPKNNLASIDPVCGLQVDPEKSSLLEVVRGHTYFFCDEKCRNKFNTNPTKYLDVFNITKKRKNWWGRYLDRLQKVTNGQPPKCCQ
jgi:YHS domain-containing protein